MHKKSLEISKKCSTPTAKDSTHSDSFCDASEQQVSETQEEEEVELLEEEDVEEEVAIDLSSSSKQQQEVGASTRSSPSPQRQSGSELDKHSWRWGGASAENWQNPEIWLILLSGNSANKQIAVILDAMQSIFI